MAKKIFGETKYLVHGGEKEQRRKRRKIFGEGTKNFAEEKKNGEGKGGKYHGEGKIDRTGQVNG